MEINGRNYWDPLARVKEIEIAVARLPMDAPLKEHFEFLLGVIDAYDRGRPFPVRRPYRTPGCRRLPCLCSPVRHPFPVRYRELEAVRI